MILFNRIDQINPVR